MTAQLLDGLAILASIKTELAQRVAALAERGMVPGLGTILVGDDPGSQWYVNAKHRDCHEIGIASIRRDLPAGTSLAEVLAAVDELNADPGCTGFLVQQPTGLDENAILSRVDPGKDVDGLHPMNLGWLVLGQDAPLPCTPKGCIELLRRYDVPIAGARVAVVGRGITVGRPLGLMLTRRSENATVVTCHTGTKDLAAELRRADIIVAAAGVPHMVTPDMVAPGAAVLDVGVSRIVAEDGTKVVAGDVHPQVREVAVIGQRDADWGEVVVAFLVAGNAGPVADAALDALCHDHIARFKRPKAYRWVDALPKNSYGKVLKTALRSLLAAEG